LIENGNFACSHRTKKYQNLAKIGVSKFLITYQAEILVTCIIRVD
jgi:hypothetical protein